MRLSDLTTLRNIGSSMEKRLNAVGISTAEQLRSMGSKEAFVKLKAHDPSVCVVFLYTLEGAVSDVDYNHLPEDVKQDLIAFSRGL